MILEVGGPNRAKTLIKQALSQEKTMGFRLLVVSFLMGSFSNLCSAYVPYSPNINQPSNEENKFVLVIALLTMFILVIAIQFLFRQKTNKTNKEEDPLIQGTPFFPEDRRANKTMSEMSEFNPEEIDPVAEADVFLAF